MQLKPFLLDIWLDTYEHDIEFNLASSEGPRWTMNEILSLASKEERERFLNHNWPIAARLVPTACARHRRNAAG